MKHIVYTNKAPKPIGPYSQAVKVGGFLYLSGQIAIQPESNELVCTTIEEEAKQVMENIAAILADAHYSFQDIVKVSIFLTDMSLFSVVNAIYESYFESEFPARETIAVAGLPKNVNVEIALVAFQG